MLLVLSPRSARMEMPLLVRRIVRFRVWFPVVLAALVVAALVAAIRAERVAARRAQRGNCLRQIGFAIASYDDAYRELPSLATRDELGRPQRSWRYVLFSFLASGLTVIPGNTSWTDPACRYWAARGMWIYCLAVEGNEAERAETNVVAVTGRGTAWSGKRRTRLSEIDPDTILAIEIRHSGIHWMEPRDLDIDEIPESITEGVDGCGVHVLFADCTVWFLRKEVPLEDLKRFFTIEGAKQYDRREVLGPYRSPGAGG